jgi:hypothetical protein
VRPKGNVHGVSVAGSVRATVKVFGPMMLDGDGAGEGGRGGGEDGGDGDERAGENGEAGGEVRGGEGPGGSCEDGVLSGGDEWLKLVNPASLTVCSPCPPSLPRTLPPWFPRSPSPLYRACTRALEGDKAWPRRYSHAA